MLFGKKECRLSKVLTESERNTVRRCLLTGAAGGATQGIREACAGMLDVVKADEVIIPAAVQGLINLCKAAGGDTGEIRTICKKLQKYV